jgi:hypothetical protein
MKASLTCAQCRELIPRYRAQHLPNAERVAVTRHIAGCAVCRGELAFWLAVGDAIDESDARQQITVDQARVWRRVREALASERREPAIQLQERGRSMTTPTPTPTPARNAGIPPMPPTASRRQSLVALAAFALVVALSATLFGVIAPRLRQDATATSRGSKASATPAACAPSQLRQRLPAHAELSAISMVSARDGWAVGQILDLSHPATAPQALIMRFQNCQWRQAGQTIPAAQLTAVAMTSPTDGWAVGTTMTSVNTGASVVWVDERGLLLHYHDGVWQSVAFPDSHVPVYEQIRMVSPTDGWMLIFEGKVHTTPYTVAENYALYHYDGTAWRAQPMPFKTPSLDLADLAAGPGDLWIVGSDTDGFGCCGVIARYHGGQWSTWKNLISKSGLDTFDAVALVSPRNVWVFGAHRANSQTPDNTGVALRYDGANWSQVPIAGGPVSAPGAVAVSSSGDVWGVLPSGLVPEGPTNEGNAITVTVIHCEAAGCQAISSKLVGLNGVGALTMFSATQGFAISGRIYGEASALLYFDSGQWSVIPAAS